MRKKLSAYKHVLIIPIYGLLYLICFASVEKSIRNDYTILHTKIDEMIPFCEYFAVFYYIWFLYMAVTIMVITLTDKDDFYKTAVFLMVGMTLFIIISAIFPNGQNLRPTEFARDNFFTDLVKHMYSIDTPTNILPSIHVYNSIGCHLGLSNCKNTKNKRWVLVVSFIMCVAIIMSTMLIKQHSTLDVFCSFVLAIVVYPLSYRIDWINLVEKIKVRFA